MTDYIGPHESMPIIRARVHGEVSDRLQILADGTFLKGDGKGVLSPSAEGGEGVSLAAVGDGTTDDIAAINATLAANPGKPIRGTRGKTYLISAPIVVKSGQTLDLTGCTIKLKPGTGGNMLVNEAVTAARFVHDGAMTSGSATLTSAAANFTQADVGKKVYVVGASATARQTQGAFTARERLETTIQSVTNATTAVLVDPAGNTVSNAWVTIGTRDQDITIIGGTWDRGANGTSPGNIGYTANSLRLRRVDGLRIRDVKGLSTAGKYFVNVGDVWDFSITGTRSRVASDTVHVNGPARYGVIRDTFSENSGDDVVSLTGCDFVSIATMQDTFGDLRDITVDGVKAQQGCERGVICGSGTDSASGWTATASRITIRDVKGLVKSEGVRVGGGTGDPNTQGGSYERILIEDVQTQTGSTSTKAPVVTIADGTVDDFTLRRISSGPSPGGAGTGNGERAILGVGDTLAPAVTMLTVDDIRHREGYASTAAVMLNKGSIEHLIVSKAQVKAAGDGVALVRLSSGTTIQRLTISDSYLENAAGGNVVGTVQANATGLTLDTVELSNVSTKNVEYPLGQYQNVTTKVKAKNVTASGSMTGWINALGTTAALDVWSFGLDGPTDAIAVAAGCSIRSRTDGLRGDVKTTGLAANNGDRFFNTNGSFLGGPWLCEGTVWRPQRPSTGSATWDPPSVADQASTSTTVSVFGAALGDVCVASFTQAIPAGVALTAAVTSSGTVTVTLLNQSGAAVDLASGTVRVKCLAQ